MMPMIHHTLQERPVIYHNKYSKPTLFCNHHTCHGGCSPCVITVILDQSYYFTQARCRNHVVILEVSFFTATATLIMSECQM